MPSIFWGLGWELESDYWSVNAAPRNYPRTIGHAFLPSGFKDDRNELCVQLLDSLRENPYDTASTPSQDQGPQNHKLTGFPDKGSHWEPADALPLLTVHLPPWPLGCISGPGWLQFSRLNYNHHLSCFKAALPFPQGLDEALSAPDVQFILSGFLETGPISFLLPLMLLMPQEKNTELRPFLLKAFSKLHQGMAEEFQNIQSLYPVAFGIWREEVRLGVQKIHKLSCFSSFLKF